MPRLVCAATLFVALSSLVSVSAPVPVVPPDPTKDREGNPLPKGATARLGSLAFRGPSMSQLGFSQDGKQLLADSPTGGVLLWDADTGKPLGLKTLKPEELKRVTPTAGSPALRGDGPETSADGKRALLRERVLEKDKGGKVVSVTWKDELIVQDAVAKKEIGKLELGARPQDFRFVGPDAAIVFASKHRPPLPPILTLSRWNLTTLKREWVTPVPAYYGLTMSADGKRCAITDWQCAAMVFDTVTGKLLGEQPGHVPHVMWAGFSPDGERVTTAGANGARVWTRGGERKIAAEVPELARSRVWPPHHGEHLVWVAFSEEGKKAELVGLDTQKGAVGWRMPVEGEGPERILSHDGKRVVGVSWDNGQRLWDVTVHDGPTGKKLHAWTLKPEGNGGLHAWPPLALSSDGGVLFVGGDGVRGLDVTTGKEKLRVDAGPIQADHTPAPSPMAVSADGTRLALIREKTLRVIEVKTGKEIASHDLGKAYHPALRFSPNGKSVAVWNMWGTTVQVCDAESSLTEPRTLEGGNGRALCAAFSPNGASLVVGYQDGTALVWDLTAK